MKIEPFNPIDHKEAVLKLFKTSLVNTGDDQWFSWKHVEGPWGPSKGYVAIEEGVIAGARFFMPWQFRAGDALLSAFRPVDTVTSPAFRGKGVFTRLTLHGLAELRSTGVALIFNTPNASSLPGYLKMGWKLSPHRYSHYFFLTPRIGALPPVEIGSVLTGWKIPTHAGSSDQLETVKSQDFMQWRYASANNNYKFSRFISDPSAFLVFKIVSRRGLKILAVKDYAGEARLVEPLILSTARALGVWIGHTVVASFRPQRMAWSVVRGQSNVTLNLPEQFFHQKFAFSPGDLEGVM